MAGIPGGSSQGCSPWTSLSCPVRAPALEFRGVLSFKNPRIISEGRDSKPDPTPWALPAIPDCSEPRPSSKCSLKAELEEFQLGGCPALIVPTPWSRRALEKSPTAHSRLQIQFEDVLLWVFPDFLSHSMLFQLAPSRLFPFSQEN